MAIAAAVASSSSQISLSAAIRAPDQVTIDLESLPGEPSECAVAITPQRLDDSRANGIGRLAADETRDLLLFPDPLNRPIAAFLNLTVVGPTANGYLVAWKAGEAMPTTSNVNWSAEQTVANLALVEVSAGGSISVRNQSAGSIHLAVDAQGVIR